MLPRHKRRLQTLSATLLLLPVSWACSDGANPEIRVQSRDSSGVTLVESSGFPQDGAGGWAVAPDPAVRIGTLEGDTLYQLFRISDGVLLEDGRIVVADNGNHQIRIFGPDGDFLRSAGREGEGPGEFQQIRIMGVLGADTLVVLDPFQRRISLFHPERGFVSQASIQDEVGMAHFSNGMFQDGSVVFGGGLLSGPGSALPADGYSRDPTSYHSVDRKGRVAVDFGEFPGPEIFFRTQGGGGEMLVSATVPHFGKRPLAVARGRQLILGSGDAYELLVFDPRGRPTRIIRILTPPTRVTGEHLDTLLQERLSAVEDPSVAPRVRSSFQEVPHAEFLPAFGDLILDSEGFLWVEDYLLPGERVSHWTVFDTLGAPVTRLHLPPGHEILDMGEERILTLFRDELGVEFLAVLHLNRGT